MSENTKPRQFEIFYSGMAGTFSVRNNLDAYLMNVQNLKDDEYIRLVELAPILKLMSEMAEVLAFYGGMNWNDPVKLGNCKTFHGVYSEIDYSDWYEHEGDKIGGKRAKEKLESYKSFINSNNLEAGE